MPVPWKLIRLPIILCGCSSDMSPLLKRVSRHKQILVTVLPTAWLSLTVIDSRFCYCGIALISLPPCGDKVPSSPTTDLASHFFFFCWGNASLFSSWIFTTPACFIFLFYPKVLQILNSSICSSVFRFQVLVLFVCTFDLSESNNKKRKMWTKSCCDG